MTQDYGKNPKIARNETKLQEMKQSLTITKSGATTWITPLSYDILIVAYLFLLHLLKNNPY